MMAKKQTRLPGAWHGPGLASRVTAVTVRPSTGRTPPYGHGDGGR